MTLEQGMDTARGRSIAAQLRSHGGLLSDISVQGGAMMSVLEEAWGGADTEQFARSWGAARPQLERAAQHVTDLGEELVRQADSQDEASAGAGRGFPPGLPPTLPPGPPLPPIPKLPSLPSIFDGLIQLAQDVGGAIVEGIRSIYAGLANMALDIVGFLDEAAQILKKFPLLRQVFAFAGKVTPFLGALLSGMDIGEALWKLTHEGGWRNADNWLHLAQGVTGAGAAVLGAVALVATGTIFGAPAGLVLGAGALVLGGISLGISVYREFDTEINEAAQWAWDNGFIGGPFNPNRPSLPLPSFPPIIPGWPSPLPKPDFPGLPLPSLPGLPSLPDLPSLPGLPSLPSLPDLPSLPKPDLPGVSLPKLW